MSASPPEGSPRTDNDHAARAEALASGSANSGVSSRVSPASPRIPAPKAAARRVSAAGSASSRERSGPARSSPMRPSARAARARVGARSSCAAAESAAASKSRRSSSSRRRASDAGLDRCGGCRRLGLRRGESRCRRRYPAGASERQPRRHGQRPADARAHRAATLRRGDDPRGCAGVPPCRSCPASSRRRKRPGRSGPHAPPRRRWRRPRRRCGRAAGRSSRD